MNSLNSSLYRRSEGGAGAATGRGDRRRRGFTLVELLMALAILSAALAIAWGTFASILTAWRRGEEALATLRASDLAADEIAAALRSAFHRRSEDGRYGFQLETDTRGESARSVRWTSLGGPAVPNAAVPAGLPRRLTLAIEPDEANQPRAVLRAAPAHLRLEEHRPDPIARIWPDIVRFSCRVWNANEKQWETSWENTNAIPSRVEMVFWTQPSPDREPIESRRMVDLMVFRGGGVLDEGTAEGRRRRAQAPGSDPTPVPAVVRPPNP